MYLKTHFNTFYVIYLEKRHWYIKFILHNNNNSYLLSTTIIIAYRQINSQPRTNLSSQEQKIK